MKKYIPIVLLLIACFSSLNVLSQDAEEIKKAEDYLARKGEFFFKFTAENFEHVQSFDRVVSIDNVAPLKDGQFTVFAYANRKELNAFLQRKLDFEVLAHPGELLKNPKMLNDPSQRDVNSWDFYPTYSAYLTMMYAFESNYPEICKIINIGQSNNGREILYCVISDNITAYEPEPKFNYTSSIHGDETTGYVLTLRLIDHILTNYGTDAQISSLVDGAEIWINPLANPDGTFYAGNNNVSGAIRYNSMGVDLNRNFPDFDDGPHPDGNAWQTETQIMMDLADSVHFVMAANFHGGAEVMNYPWDTQSILNADDAWWQYVSRQYVDTAQLYGPTGYLTDLNNGITNGYAWYTISGGRQDYMNYYHRTREVTAEISAVKNPATTALNSYWDANYRSMLNYMNQVLWGVKGFVTDSITGAPLEANVLISGYDAFNTDVFSSLPYGDYYRPLYAGSYDITYSAMGYASKTITTIVTNETAIQQNVQLVPSAPQVNFLADIVESCTGEVQFTDLTNTSAGSTYLWNFGDGNTSTEQEPFHIYNLNGTFDVSLTVTNSIGTETLNMPAIFTINRPDPPTISNDSLCGPGTATLIAQSQGTINWYTDSIGGTPFHNGDTLELGAISTSEYYYVENSVEPASQYTGKTDNSGGGGYYTNNSSHYLVFDCYAPVTLQSVRVYANSAGDRTIMLRDNSGNMVDFATVSLTSGDQIVELNFEIPVGIDFELAGPPSPDLYRNNAGLNYPYEIPGVISVKHSSAGSDPTGYYYYFYDWKIKESDCNSPRVPISAFIYDASPVTSFTYVETFGSVEFTNTSINGGSYFWDFGDGTTSTETNPIHEFQLDGLYTVSLTTLNTCGTDSFTIDLNILVTVAEDIIGNNKFSVYPNPTNRDINVILKTEQANVLELNIFNVLGEKVFIEQVSNYSGEFIKMISLETLPQGIYILNASSDKFNLSKRILIER